MLYPAINNDILSLLLWGFPKSKAEASDKLLKAIFKTPSGLSSHDFGALIEKLLRQNKVQQSVEMCFKNDVSVSKIGYIHVLEHYLYSSEAHSDREIFLKTFCRQFKKLPTSDPAYYLFTSKIFGYFTTKINNSLSRTLFISKGLTALNKKESRFDFEKSFYLISSMILLSLTITTEYPVSMPSTDKPSSNKTKLTLNGVSKSSGV
ncbi:hypothetical protein CJJ09_003712 [Candidozyma auris]|nr:hypothetical protein CJJ09_003712 [[Candida] auris]